MCHLDFHFVVFTFLTFFAVTGSNIINMIHNHGYEVQTHAVLTEDQYVLNMHRITGKRHESREQYRGVILLQHGLLCSSAGWVISGPQRAFAYFLSDAGFDVWLGNFRGNRYAKKHLRISSHDPKFWNFSWHEMGKYDLPAMIRKIKEVTKVSKIKYIGHSQGTTAYFVMCSLKPEFVEEHIYPAVALAPVAIMQNIQNKMVRFLVKVFLNNMLQMPIQNLMIKLFSRTDRIIEDIRIFSGKVCRILKEAGFKEVCPVLYGLLNGYQREDVDRDLLATINQYFPEGISIKQLIHYAQLVKTGEFQSFASGKNATVKKYDLSKCKVPVMLYYSANDWISNAKDVEILSSKLKNVQYHKLNNNLFTHLDFMWYKNATNILYNEVLNYWKLQDELITKIKIS